MELHSNDKKFIVNTIWSKYKIYVAPKNFGYFRVSNLLY